MKLQSEIYPAFWFEGRAHEAAQFYSSVFENSEIESESQAAVLFKSSGQKFLFVNGGGEIVPNPAISCFVIYEDKNELDLAWEKLLEKGTVLMPLDEYDWSPRYGWIQDKFNISWQLSLGKISDVGKKYSYTLLFTGAQNGNAEKAIEFYTSVFEDSSVTGILRYTAADNDKEGNIAHAQFKLGETVFMATDSSLAHKFAFNEAVSFVVECQSQEEIDYYWEKLSAVPEAEQCGWLKDRFGVSWQIVPSVLNKMMNDPKKAQQVIQAFLQMKKFDIGKLQEAYNQQE